MARVILTGGSGKVGRACIEELLQHGYEVFNLDTARPAKERARFTQVDLTNFGQIIQCGRRGALGRHSKAFGLSECRDLQGQHAEHLQRV
jgi:nucleoside-diphosphate-sugar epimerase